MEQKMFCYQCEQTVGCSACTGAAGVCGKKADTAKLQDKLTGALIGLARALDGDPGLATAQTNELVIESLFMTLTNVNFDNDSIQAQIDRVHREQSGLVPQCAACASPCGKNEDYDMNQLWQAEENIRSLKSLLLFGLAWACSVCVPCHGAGLYRRNGKPLFPGGCWCRLVWN